MTRMARRTALLAPLALGGCSLWDDWFSNKKTPLPPASEAAATTTPPGHMQKE